MSFFFGRVVIDLDDSLEMIAESDKCGFRVILEVKDESLNGGSLVVRFDSKDAFNAFCEKHNLVINEKGGL